jgi:RNA polymerase-binding transcription factor DksA
MLTVDQLNAIEHRLDSRAAQLRQEIAGLPQRIEERALAEVDDAKDAADLEARTVVADAEVERDLAELRDIGAARKRIVEGRYGSCLDCGSDIDPRRLLAQPQTLRCLACQAVVEATLSRSS